MSTNADHVATFERAARAGTRELDSPLSAWPSTSRWSTVRVIETVALR